MKLDLAGAKIRLTDWRAFSDNDRQSLIDAPLGALSRVSRITKLVA